MTDPVMATAIDMRSHRAPGQLVDKYSQPEKRPYPHSERKSRTLDPPFGIRLLSQGHLAKLARLDH